jgi:hypothetical protein
MPEFLNTTATNSQIVQLIQSAERRLTLISPYLQISKQVMSRLKLADARGVETHLVHRTGELSEGERVKLKELKRLTLYSLANLHAKCYANERNVLISSMNLYGHSEVNNWEMSILLSEEDGKVITDARREIESIFQTAVREPAPGGIRSMFASVFQRPPVPAAQKPAAKVQEGFCIRCGDDIRYRPLSPLCGSCYSTWAAWGNEDFPEKNCHRCGDRADVTKAKPLCAPCFRAAPFPPASRSF